MSESTEPNVLKIIWGLLEHVSMSNCARHREWPPVRGVQGASPYFGIRYQNVFFFCRTIRPIRIKFGVVHKAMRPCHFVLHSWICPLRSGWGTILTHESSIIVRNLFVGKYGSESTEFIMRASGACLDMKLGSAWRFAPGKGRPSFWLWTQKRPFLQNYLQSN